MHPILVLDGLDESPSDKSSITTTIKNIAGHAALLVSCRQYDFERYLGACKEQFNAIVRLTHWDETYIKAYVRALKHAGKSRVAEFISRHLAEGVIPNFLGLPLWLGMLAYLAESEPQDVRTRPLPPNDYELIRECADKVAEAEVSRHGARADGSLLRDLWERAAWELHKAFRERRVIKVRELKSALELDGDEGLSEAVFSFLDLRGDDVRGFFHEVFKEYWLAEYIVDRMGNPAYEGQVAEVLAYQRSVVTNKFVRLRIQSREDLRNVTAILRTTFGTVSDSAETSAFAKNQIVYLLGRIDQSTETRDFLSGIWHSDEEAFVRYAAAWGETMAGNGAVENEYSDCLRQYPEWDRMNRGYHLYYYGDVDVEEDRMPPVDDGSTSAEATLRTLFRRLRRNEARHVNLRRIELFTLRRFLETGRKLPREISDAKAIINEAGRVPGDHLFGQKFVQGVRAEADAALMLL